MAIEAIHPGEHIVDQLEAMNMTPAAFVDPTQPCKLPNALTGKVKNPDSKNQRNH